MAIDLAMWQRINPTVEVTILDQLLQQNSLVSTLTKEQLFACIAYANYCYREGNPIIDDTTYDHQWLAQLKKLDPNHAFFERPEPELVVADNRVRLPQKMLSTEKAYHNSELIKWLQRIEKAAATLNITTITIKATPKLDGFAAFDDGTQLYTRGDGTYGRDISFVFDRGLKVVGNKRGLGAGEIVTNKHYFKQHMQTEFANTRQVQGAVIAKKTMKEVIAKSLKDGATIFYPFSELPALYIKPSELIDSVDAIVEKMTSSIDYDYDGVIFEVTDEAIKAAMGSTLHHHRWQIAFKANQQTATAEVVEVKPQTSRTGRVNPVLQIKPTPLSGVVISNVTAYHYRYIQDNNIGPGTTFELVRSGLVIPKIERLIQTTTPQIPSHCPSCEQPLSWSSDFLMCTNHKNCPSQVIKGISYFFDKIGNINGFGDKTIAFLYHFADVSTIVDVFKLTEQQLFNAFEAKRKQQAEEPKAKSNRKKSIQNLLSELQSCQLRPIEDWRLLSAFGIEGLADGNCELLLSQYSLNQIFDITAEQLIAIDGFAELTANKCIEQLQTNRELYQQILNIGFNLTATKQNQTAGQLSGETIVFTGAMPKSRSEMKQLAKAQGAKVADAISKQTTLLVTGNNVGANKITKAKQFNIKQQSVDDFLANIENILPTNV